MSMRALLVRFVLVFALAYVAVTVWMIFVIALFGLPSAIETIVPYVLAWGVSFYALNQYYEKNRRFLVKKQRWGMIVLMTLGAWLVSVLFSYPVHSTQLLSDLQRLFVWSFFVFPAYLVLIWSADSRAQKRLLEHYPELKLSCHSSTSEVP